MDKIIVKSAMEFVRNIFKDDHSGHDYFHTLRVYKMATRIAEHENASLIIVQLAALLHDVDDSKLSPETYVNKDRAVAFLREHSVSETMIKTICGIIGEVSFRGTDSITPRTIEGKCVQDADRLDAIGGIGLAEFEFFEDCAELQKLYLTDDVKGSGMGYNLIGLIEDKAREYGYKRLYLETHTNLEAAIHIYGKSDFKVIEKPAGVVHATMDRFYIKDLSLH